MQHAAITDRHRGHTDVIFDIWSLIFSYSLKYRFLHVFCQFCRRKFKGPFIKYVPTWGREGVSPTSMQYGLFYSKNVRGGQKCPFLVVLTLWTDRDKKPVEHLAWAKFVILKIQWGKRRKEKHRHKITSYTLAVKSRGTQGLTKQAKPPQIGQPHSLHQIWSLFVLYFITHCLLLICISLPYILFLTPPLHFISTPSPNSHTQKINCF